MTCEVLVIGGGVIGLSIARELRRSGVSDIILADRGVCGEEASWAAAGMLAPQAEADRDDAMFRFCRESAAMYPHFAADLLAETGIDIELDPTGTLYLAFDDASENANDRRFEWQTAAGLPVEHLPADAVRDAEPAISAKVRSALFFRSDRQVENRLLMRALRRYAVENGIEVIENCGVQSITRSGERMAAAVTGRSQIAANTIVVATGAWTSFIEIDGRGMPVDIRPVRGQMISFAPAERLIDHVVYGPDVYLVPRRDGRILAGATVEDAGFDKTVATDATEKLREAACRILPKLRDVRISEKWAGLRPCSPDALPVLGMLGGIEGLHIATAHYRNGILLAPLTARIVADSILAGTPSRFLDAFSPDRFTKQTARCGSAK